MPAAPGQPAIAEEMTAILDGDATVTASTTDGWATSYALMSVMGLQMGLDTTLTLENLGYQPDPFCITSGSFTLQQVWNPRPMGATYQDLPDQGWIFAFQGCGQFTVAPGST